MARDRKFWGWGYEDERAEEREYMPWLKTFGGGCEAATIPTEEEFDLPEPRVAPPRSLASICRKRTHTRLAHAYGKSFPDSVRPFLRQAPHVPDFVVYPEEQEDIERILEWAAGAGVAVIPVGGGSSVCGGITPDIGEAYSGVITLDMEHMDAVLEIDPISRAARIQGGIYGPALEAKLKEHNFTLRHFPQSFQYSTLGGWIATRAGGHYASLYTHIDDFVESTKMITPNGIMETRRLPGSGAGPSPDRMVIGSEGSFGVITEAWMRLQDIPTFRASTTALFDDFYIGAEAVRRLSQSGLFPSNCRLLDPIEAQATGAGDGSGALLVLGFESADHPVDAWMARAVELVRDNGGKVNEAALAKENSHRDAAAGSWRKAFIRMPFLREELVRRGLIIDTFESSITWDHFQAFHEKVMTATSRAIKQATGAMGFVTCRFTHIYPDGPAPYFTFFGVGKSGMDGVLDQWAAIKTAASDAVIEAGGTITHHHATGRDHRPWYERQTPDIYRAALQGAKNAFDPTGIMNPGVLVDPLNTPELKEPVKKGVYKKGRYT